MPVITVPRPDLTPEDVVTVLRDGLGPRYNVLPGMVMGRTALGDPRKGQPNMIVVGTGENRVIKAQVTITQRDGQTQLRVRPGGVTADLLFNTFGVARKVRAVLASAPALSAR